MLCLLLDSGKIIIHEIEIEIIEKAEISINYSSYKVPFVLEGDAGKTFTIWVEEPKSIEIKSGKVKEIRSTKVVSEKIRNRA
ncbi:hypothetical protein OPIT5_00690 [Opitutaceae bacterium TAV5]|nr:hypothetical protein OPIT5_00690 [Opitutaceae bacterium TAV5]